VLNVITIHELRKIRKEAIMAQFEMLTCIYLKVLRKIMRNVGHNTRSPGRDLIPRPPKHEVGMLTSLPRRLEVNIENEL
jgi:hypothetical protein